MRQVRMLVAVPAGLVTMAAAALVVGAGLPFWLVGGLVRTLLRLFRSRVLAWSDLVVYDPDLGWRPRPDLDGRWLEQRHDVFRVVTDCEGWHGRRRLDDARVVVLGDSHAFGYGIDAPRSFAHLVPDGAVKAVGAPGYNNVQELALLHELAPRLAARTVVWLVYAGNDLYDNLAPEMSGYRTPYVRETADGGWETVTRHVGPQRWVVSRGRAGRQHLPTLAALHAPTPLARRAYAACAWLVGQGRDVCRASGARLVVALLPSPWTLTEEGMATLRQHSVRPDALRPDFPDTALGAACRDLEVPFIALRAYLERQDFHPYDDHWTPRGHRKMAAVFGVMAGAA
jgi:hypothetical protein